MPSWSHRICFDPVCPHWCCISTFFFSPFSLWVGCLLDFIHGDCMAESSILADSSSDWSFRVSPSFGPLSRNEIKLSFRVLISSSSREISVSLPHPQNSTWSLQGVYWAGGWYQEADSLNMTSRLTQASLVRGLLLGTWSPRMGNRTSRSDEPGGGNRIGSSVNQKQGCICKYVPMSLLRLYL